MGVLGITAAEIQAGLPPPVEEHYSIGTMEALSPGRLDELDGLNPTRALILQAYYAVRRTCGPRQIGVPQVVGWIVHHEPDASLPSDALVQLTLAHANVPHRPPGRPRRDGSAPTLAPPFLSSPPPLPTWEPR
jgi:hypothetical protein